MQNIITFAHNYQDKNFEEFPFNMVDSLILSQVAYYKYAGTDFEEKEFILSLQDILQLPEEIILHGVQTADEDKKLIDVLRSGGRHGELYGCAYKEIADADIGEQFAAITFRIKEDEYYIAFRGTDTSVTGWKEDMCLSFQDEIPAQRTALQYTIDVMRRLQGKFYLGGHSKGGNLAVYTAIHLPKELQNRLIKIYNHDGPGFFEEVYESKKYKKIRPIICKTVPHSSVVGLLLECDDNYIVVESNAKGLLQHVPYTWTVKEDSFYELEEVDRLAYHTKQILERWLSEISFEKREQIVETVFDIISDTGISGFEELTEERVQKVRMVIDSISGTDQEEKKLIGESIRRLFKISADEFHQAAKEQRDIKKEEIIQFRDSLKEVNIGETIKETLKDTNLGETIKETLKEANLGETIKETLKEVNLGESIKDTLKDSAIGERIKESVDFIKRKTDNK